MKVKKNKPLEIITILSIILAIAIIAMLVYNIINKNKSNSENKSIIDTSTGKIVTGELSKIYKMGEDERINYYFSKYVEHLKNKEYDKCYSFLDDKFKNNYFKTLESFEKYVEEKYSDIINVTYDDITRLGNYYVLDITFIDLFASTAEEMVGKTQKFVIYETDYNEYKLSFQAE